jgi:4'-phosphopantetheinyl transferase
LKDIDKITEKRKDRISRHIRQEDKARSLVAGLLLREVCGVECDTQLAYGEKGKPYLLDNTLKFNLSHSGDFVVLAVSDTEIGVDIEKIKPYNKAVAKRCFTSAELEWLSEENTNEAFYRLWTAKESIMKATGAGFSLPPQSFCTLHTPWCLHHFNYNGYVVCVASADKTEAPQITVKE